MLARASRPLKAGEEAWNQSHTSTNRTNQYGIDCAQASNKYGKRLTLTAKAFIQYSLYIIIYIQLNLECFDALAVIIWHMFDTCNGGTTQTYWLLQPILWTILNTPIQICICLFRLLHCHLKTSTPGDLRYVWSVVPSGDAARKVHQYWRGLLVQADVTCCDHAVFHNRDICCILQILLQHGLARITMAVAKTERWWESLYPFYVFWVRARCPRCEAEASFGARAVWGLAL